MKTLQIILVIFLYFATNWVQGQNFAWPWAQDTSIQEERFNGKGLPLWEIQDDIRFLANMHKWRYSKVLPINFRHEFMIRVTKYILDRLPEIKNDMKR